MSDDDRQLLRAILRLQQDIAADPGPGRDFQGTRRHASSHVHMYAAWQRRALYGPKVVELYLGTLGQ